MTEFKPLTESGIKPDIILPDGSRLRSLPWGGRQCAGMGIRRWAGGFEVVDLHPQTLEPFPKTTCYRFARLGDAAAWAVYVTLRVANFLFGEPEPVEPAVQPIEPVPSAPEPPKARNRHAGPTVTITLS